jgi:hypothetical protein
MDRERTLLERPDINDLAGWSEWIAQVRERHAGMETDLATEELAYFLEQRGLDKHKAVNDAMAAMRSAQTAEVKAMREEIVALRSMARTTINSLRDVRKKLRIAKDLITKSI